MNINLNNLINNYEEELLIDDTVIIPKELIKESNIRDLKNTCFKGTITRLFDNKFLLEGKLSGIMVLADDITLEDVEYKFNIEISEEIDEFRQNFENNLKINQNILDITEFLWQNILVEIPLKIVSEKNKDLKLEGNGWRLITEDDLNTSNNSPFSELEEKFNSRKE